MNHATYVEAEPKRGHGIGQVADVVKADCWELAIHCQEWHAILNGNHHHPNCGNSHHNCGKVGKLLKL